MKYSDLPVKNFNELSENTFIICSDIVTKEDNEVEAVNKLMINASEIANKSDLVSLAEQNSQLIKIVNQLISKQQELERIINDKLNKQSNTIDLSSIQKEINIIKERLENSIVEL